MGSMDVYLNVKFDVNQEKLKKIKNKAVVRYCETKGKDQSCCSSLRNLSRLK